MHFDLLASSHGISEVVRAQSYVIIRDLSFESTYQISDTTEFSAYNILFIPFVCGESIPEVSTNSCKQSYTIP